MRGDKGEEEGEERAGRGRDKRSTLNPPLPSLPPPREDDATGDPGPLPIEASPNEDATPLLPIGGGAVEPSGGESVARDVWLPRQLESPTPLSSLLVSPLRR